MIARNSALDIVLWCLIITTTFNPTWQPEKFPYQAAFAVSLLIVTLGLHYLVRREHFTHFMGCLLLLLEVWICWNLNLAPVWLLIVAAVSGLTFACYHLYRYQQELHRDAA